MARCELTDAEWKIIAPLLPRKSRGVKRVDDRRVLNGIFWRLRSGAPWADIPERYGPPTTCYNRFVRWRAAGISRLPATEGDKPSTKKFRAYPIGYFHIDIAEVRTGEGKLHLFVAIDRTSKFAYAELHKRADRKTATAFLKALIKAVPYKIHTVLTDNGIQFADLPKNRTGPTALWRGHMFDLLCQQHGIEHRLTKPNHPWTNGQVERMNRTLKEATVNRYHYESHSQLKQHLHTFLMAYNFAKRLKTLRGLTPYEHICKVWTEQPKRFRLNPLHHTLGLNT
jgi:transposase